MDFDMLDEPPPYVPDWKSHGSDTEAAAVLTSLAERPFDFLTRRQVDEEGRMFGRSMSMSSNEQGYSWPAERPALERELGKDVDSWSPAPEAMESFPSEMVYGDTSPLDMRHAQPMNGEASPGDLPGPASMDPEYLPSDDLGRPLKLVKRFLEAPESERRATPDWPPNQPEPDEIAPFMAMAEVTNGVAESSPDPSPSLMIAHSKATRSYATQIDMEPFHPSRRDAETPLNGEYANKGFPNGDEKQLNGDVADFKSGQTDLQSDAELPTEPELALEDEPSPFANEVDTPDSPPRPWYARTAQELLDSIAQKFVIDNSAGKRQSTPAPVADIGDSPIVIAADFGSRGKRSEGVGVQVTPKKRGRPRKSEGLSNPASATEEDEAEEGTTESRSFAYIRRRARSEAPRSTYGGDGTDDPEVMSTMTPRGRGRPRKSVPPETRDVATTSIPRGPGRPRKSVPPEAMGSTTSANIPKKAGRPRKSAPPETTGALTSANTPRRPGRPRKSMPSETNNGSTSAGTPRGPGRPRKSIPVRDPSDAVPANTPRKPGRPRKIAPPKATHEVVLASTPRGPGRPRKTAIAPEPSQIEEGGQDAKSVHTHDDAEEHEIPAAEPSQPRKRGRQRKSFATTPAEPSSHHTRMGIDEKEEAIIDEAVQRSTKELGRSPETAPFEDQPLEFVSSDLPREKRGRPRKVHRIEEPVSFPTLFGQKRSRQSLADEEVTEHKPKKRRIDETGGPHMDTEHEEDANSSPRSRVRPRKPDVMMEAIENSRKSSFAALDVQETELVAPPVVLDYPRPRGRPRKSSVMQDTVEPAYEEPSAPEVAVEMDMSSVDVTKGSARPRGRPRISTAVRETVESPREESTSLRRTLQNNPVVEAGPTSLPFTTNSPRPRGRPRKSIIAHEAPELTQDEVSDLGLAAQADISRPPVAMESPRRRGRPRKSIMTNMAADLAHENSIGLESDAETDILSTPIVTKIPRPRGRPRKSTVTNDVAESTHVKDLNVKPAPEIGVPDTPIAVGSSRPRGRPRKSTISRKAGESAQEDPVVANTVQKDQLAAEEDSFGTPVAAEPVRRGRGRPSKVRK